MTENTSSTVMPVAPMGYSGGGFGGFGGDGSWLIVLFLFAMMGGWGNGGWGGNGGGNCFYPWALANNTDNNITAGFANAGVTSQLSGIQSSITSGFAGAEVAGCNRTIDALTASYTNQIASMNQSFANAQALDARLDALAMSLQSCCCENRAGIADLKYTVATEACADRAAISSALRDVIEANTASTQRILDQLCADKIDAKNERIADLERQLTAANFAASQSAQTSRILADNSRQTSTLEQYLAPNPIPAYIVQNPNCCGANAGCGCGSF